MIKIRIPFKTFAEINGTNKCIGQTIVSEESYSEGKLAYIDELGLCRTKSGKVITTTNQANIIIKLKDENELISAIKKYKPTDLWF